MTTLGRTQVSVETLKECENSECIPDLQLKLINSTFEYVMGKEERERERGGGNKRNLRFTFDNALP